MTWISVSSLSFTLLEIGIRDHYGLPTSMSALANPKVVIYSLVPSGSIDLRYVGGGI